MVTFIQQALSALTGVVLVFSGFGRLPKTVHHNLPLAQSLHCHHFLIWLGHIPWYQFGSIWTFYHNPSPQSLILIARVNAIHRTTSLGGHCIFCWVGYTNFKNRILKDNLSELLPYSDFYFIACFYQWDLFPTLYFSEPYWLSESQNYKHLTCCHSFLSINF